MACILMIEERDKATLCARDVHRVAGRRAEQRAPLSLSTHQLKTRAPFTGQQRLAAPLARIHMSGPMTRGIESFDCSEP